MSELSPDTLKPVTPIINRVEQSKPQQLHSVFTKLNSYQEHHRAFTEIADRSSEILQKSPLRMYLPGMTGGGTALTYIRETLQDAYGKENVYVVSSISTREAFKAGDKLTPGAHALEVAKEIARMAKDRNIQIVGHSMGGNEVVGILNQLMKNTDWLGKSIELTFVSTPGFGEKQVKGILNVVGIAKRLNIGVSVSEQHTLCPLPQDFYDAVSSQQPVDMERVFTDTPTYREQRRQEFVQYVEKMIPNDAQRQALLDKIDRMDRRILSLMKSSEPLAQSFLDDALKERGQLMKPIFNQMWKGGQIDQARHEEQLKLYKETADKLAPGFLAKQLASAYSVFGTLAKGWTGMEAAVATQVIDEAKKREIEVKLKFAFPEKDRVVPFTDIDVIKNGLNGEGLLGYVNGFSLIETSAHSSMGYSLAPALVNLYKSSK